MNPSSTASDRGDARTPHVAGGPARSLPGPPRGRVRIDRLDRFADVAWRLGVSVVLGAVVLVALRFAPRPDYADGWAWLVVDAMLGACAVAALLWRHRFPVTVAVGTALLTSVAASGLGAALVALVSVAKRRRPREIVAAVVASWVGGFAFEYVHEVGARGILHDDASAVTIAVTIAAPLVAAAVGVYLGSPRPRAPRLLPPRTDDPSVPDGPWATTWRLGAAGLVGVAFLVIASTSARPFAGSGPWWLFGDLAVGTACVVALLWRRAYPLPVALGILVAAAFAFSPAGAACVALVSVGARRRWREIALVGAVGIAASVLIEYVHMPSAPEDSVSFLGNLAASVGFVAVLMTIGMYVGARREIVAGLYAKVADATREQDLRIMQAQAAERTRIAREMHDVVAHSISRVAMHAGALSYRDDLTPEEVRAAATIIQENAHAALTELRGVLGVLRDPSASGSPEAPMPTLRDLDALVRASREDGVEVAIEQDRDLDRMPDQLSRSAFRIIQESITNARRHAPGMPVSVALRGSAGGRLDIVVSNPVGTSTPSADGAGLGVVGMRERAELAGGTLAAGVDRAGRFVLRAELPWPA